MPMRLIEGTFRIIGSQPDGDSIRFYPNNPSEWDLVDGPHRVHTNTNGGAQMRLDGIDTLETHYSTTAGILHQPLELAQAAAKELLDWLGFSKVVRGADQTVTSATPERLPGYIFTRTADLYGRCVALAGRGAAPGPSGSDAFVDAAMLRKTANYRLLQRGLAYPTYYRKLFPDLRAEMTKAVGKARPNKGLWPVDATQTGARIEGLSTLADEAVILPKLYRRLADYLVLNDGDPSLAAFRDYLAQRQDRSFILSTGHSTTGLDFVVSVTGQTVKLTYQPEDLVFDER